MRLYIFIINNICIIKDRKISGQEKIKLRVIYFHQYFHENIDIHKQPRYCTISTRQS